MSWKTGWIVGAALVIAGAVLVAISESIGSGAEQLVLVVIGAGLIASGATVILRVAPLDKVQATVIGAVLIASGTATAVLSGTSAASSAVTRLTPVGGALLVAGLVELVLGSIQELDMSRS